MLVKFITGNGAFSILEDVKEFNSTDKRSFFAIPYEIRAYTYLKGKDTPAGSDYNKVNEKLMEYIHERWSSQRGVTMVENHEWTKNNEECEIQKRKVLFIDSPQLENEDVSERPDACYKLTSFESGDTQYIIMSSLPLYLCNNKGETIEIVK